jgi:thioredoxin reductase
MTPQTKLYDALIIGGGPSGLSAALSFARQTYSTVVFDSQIYRNDNASHMHNMLTWDHCPASEFRATARQNIISRYDTVKFQNSKIVLAAQDKDGNFEVTDENQAKFVGKKLVLATGVTDALPDIKGFDKLWGRAM